MELVLGSTVTVEIRLQQHVMGGKPTETFNGVVVRSEPYDPKGSFRMTGDKFMPTRVISMGCVLAINGVSPTTNIPTVKVPATSRTFKVASSKPGNFYEVVMDSTGDMTCPCPGFGFKHRCSHIDQVKDYLAKNTSK